MLDVKNLSVSYDAVTAVVDLALTIGSEECVALLGPNGAGKSSTLKAISHLLPHQGTVEFDGTDITRMPADRIAPAVRGSRRSASTTCTSCSRTSPSCVRRGAGPSPEANSRWSPSAARWWRRRAC